MIMLRSSLFSLGLLLVTPIFFVIALFTLPLPVMKRYAVISHWSRVMLFWAKVSCGLTYQVQGRENIPDKPSIVLSKHQSAWETLAFQQIFPAQVWVVKRELLHVPFFGWGLRVLNPIAIDRRHTKTALPHLVEQGRNRLALGFWIVIFPEGTRVPPGERKKYNLGGARLAEDVQALVVPVAHNAGKFWPRNSFLKYPGCITVIVGPPINPAGLHAKEINARVEAWIEGQMAGLA